MRLGLISDVHANLLGLRAVLEAMGKVDGIICAGDLTGYYTRPNEVIEEILSRQMEFIAGNHDVYLRKTPELAKPLLLASIQFTKAALTAKSAAALAGVACHKTLNYDGVRIGVFHGSPWNPQEQYIYPDFADWHRFAEVEADVVILGHTHRPIVRHVGEKLIINPGSCGQPRDGDPRASFALLDTASRQVSLGRAEFDVATVLREAENAGLGRELKPIRRHATVNP